jgi:RHS repeat-associated protein
VCNPEASTSNNRLVGTTYDSAGNTTIDATSQQYVYDGENKMVLAKDASGNAVGQYWYDGDGKRVRKYVPNTGEVTVFIYDASGKTVEEYSTALSAEPQVAYLTNDNLGTPRINTAAGGAVISRHDYHPFGEEIIGDGRTQGVGYESDEVRKQFTGYEHDRETGLDFAQARYYAKDLGRFTSPDDFLNDASQIDPSSWNLYVYTRNNPLNITDPSGETVYVGMKDPSDIQALLDDLNYTYGCTGCVTVTKDNTLAIDTSKVSADVLKAAAYLTDAITKTDYEAAVFAQNGSKEIDFGRSISGGASITENGKTRTVDRIDLDFKDRKALIGDQDAKEAFVGFIFAHEMAHLYPAPGQKDPAESEGKRKTGPVVDRTNEIARARGVLLRASYYDQEEDSSGHFGAIYMGSAELDKKTNQVKRDVKTNGISVKSEKLLRWNRELIKHMN